MTSLRVALKLSMAEAKPDEKKRKNPLLVDKKIEEPSLDDILSGRKRRASFERQSRKDKPARVAGGPRSESPADESLAGRSEGSGYYAESNSIVTDDPYKNAAFEDHESIASMKGDDNSIAEDFPTDRPNSRHEESMEMTTNYALQQPDQTGTTADKEDEQEGDAEAEDGDAEGPTNARSSKKKRKRTSSILRSLEPINGEEPTPVVEDDNLPRYQSSRAAAMVAKTKISAKGTSGRSNSMDDLGGDASGDVKAAGNSRRRKSGAGAAAVKLNWVQCDKCSKWRSVAAHVNESDLPEKWFCTMNTWDVHLNNCEAPEDEEPAQPVASVGKPKGGYGSYAGGLDEAGFADGGGEGPHSKGQHRVWVRAGNGGRGRWRRTGGQEGPDDGAPEGADDLQDEGAPPGGAQDEPTMGVASRRRSLQAAQSGAAGGSPRAPSAARGGTAPTASNPTANVAVTATTPAAVDPAAVNWVQCNKCRKWRKVPESIDVDALPDRWYCSLNTWNVAVARCNAKQEVDEVVTPAATADAPVATAVATKGANRGGRRVSGGGGGTNANAAAINCILPPGTIRQVSWVQCERRNCKKWRKVPASIDIDSLPEKWYCEMNTWDMDSATCDAPEASDSENEQSSSAVSRQQLILANSKGANALSYRRIIFGTDGRIRVCFSDKNKNGYGIFSYSEAHKPNNDADDYTAPTRRVGYWWSGAYDESAGAAAAVQSSTTALGRVSSKKQAAALAAAAESAQDLATLDAAKSTEPVAPTYLLDTARRMYGMQARPTSFSWPKKVSKSWTLLSKMPLFRRQNLECTVVMSCFMSASTSQLLFTKLFSLMEACRFSDPEVEACREYMSSEGLKAVVKRLEDKGLVEVSYTNAGQLTVDVLPSVAQLTQNCSSKGVVGASMASGVSPAWCKQGVPLKMRKFHADSKYKEGAPATHAASTVTVPNSAVEQAAQSIRARDEHNMLESLAAVSVSSTAPMKPFRLQHKEKWTVQQQQRE